MASIREYLEQGRAGKVFDPNQGLYMDPQTGQPFVPTFTNIEGSNIAQRMSPEYGEQTPYMVGPEYRQTPGGPQALPEPQRVTPEQAALPGRDEGVDPNDPWSMANASIKTMMDDIFGEMFPGKNYGDPLSQQEWQKFQGGVQSMRNALVDRYKWQIDRRDDVEKSRMKNAKSLGLTPDKLLTVQQKLSENFAMAGGEEGEDENTYVRRMLQQMIDNAQEFSGQGIPGRKEATSVSEGQDQMQMEGAEAEAGGPGPASRRGQSGIKRVGTYQGKTVVEINNQYFLEDPKSGALSPVNIIR